MSCTFCDIVAGRIQASIVFEDEISIAFLDHRPLFHGHVLLIPRQHISTLADLPVPLLQPIFATVQRLSVAVETAIPAEGSFIAINNKVSQSVPHLHIHVVPRKKKDGLRGFFWPRTKYSDEELKATVERLRSALKPV